MKPRRRGWSPTSSRRGDGLRLTLALGASLLVHLTLFVGLPRLSLDSPTPEPPAIFVDLATLAPFEATSDPGADAVETEAPEAVQTLADPRAVAAASESPAASQLAPELADDAEPPLAEDVPPSVVPRIAIEPAGPIPPRLERLAEPGVEPAVAAADATPAEDAPPSIAPRNAVEPAGPASPPPLEPPSEPVVEPEVAVARATRTLPPDTPVVAEPAAAQAEPLPAADSPSVAPDIVAAVEQARPTEAPASPAASSPGPGASAPEALAPELRGPVEPSTLARPIEPSAAPQPTTSVAQAVNPEASLPAAAPAPLPAEHRPETLVPEQAMPDTSSAPEAAVAAAPPAPQASEAPARVAETVAPDSSLHAEVPTPSGPRGAAVATAEVAEEEAGDGVLPPPPKPADLRGARPGPARTATAADGARGAASPDVLLARLDALKDETLQAEENPALWAVIRAVREQIARCWDGAVRNAASRRLRVDIDVAFGPDGRLTKARIKQPGLMVVDEAYRTFATGALDALTSCSPFELPPESYDLWRQFTMRFLPSRRPS